jgi:hypothetical protein
MSSIDEETLQRLFKLIAMSDCPEIEAEYLAKEFDLKTDELFLMYLKDRQALETSRIKSRNIFAVIRNIKENMIKLFLPQLNK